MNNVNDKASDGKSIKYKTKITGETEVRSVQGGNDGDTNWPPRNPVPTLKIEVFIPLKYLSNFRRSLDLILIDCEVELDLSWSKNCELVEHNDNMTGIDFKITSTKFYVPFVTLSMNANIKLLEHLKQGFRIAISYTFLE